LISAEECHFCKKGPLKTGWGEYEETPSKTTKLDPVFGEFLEKTSRVEIPLQQIIDLLNRSDSETIGLLESYILHGAIQGRINIREMTLHLEVEEEKYLCGVCELSQTDFTSYTCENCERKVCTDCYEEMSTVGMIFCPDCGGNLKKETKRSS